VGQEDERMCQGGVSKEVACAAGGTGDGLGCGRGRDGGLEWRKRC